MNKIANISINGVEIVDMTPQQIEQKELFNIKVQEQEQVRLAEEQAKIDAKASALAKLTALGLTEEEVKSIL
jgi:hypothetical protein